MYVRKYVRIDAISECQIECQSICPKECQNIFYMPNMTYIYTSRWYCMSETMSEWCVSAGITRSKISKVILLRKPFIISHPWCFFKSPTRCHHLFGRAWQNTLTPHSLLVPLQSHIFINLIKYQVHTPMIKYPNLHPSNWKISCMNVTWTLLPHLTPTQPHVWRSSTYI